AKPAAGTLSEEDASQAKVRREEVLPLAYEILEVSIGYLVHVSESEESMDCGLFDATGLLKIQESLQATFTAILDYLRDLQVSNVICLLPWPSRDPCIQLEQCLI